MKISNRMFITFGAIYIVASITIVALVNYNMRKQALIDGESKAFMLLNHNLAIHKYLQEMKFKMFSWSKPFRPPDYFEPTWMSSTYAIRQMNHYFKLLEKSKYYYKECAINARTPENEADPHERIFLEQLARDPRLVERSEVQTLNGQPFFVIMRRGLEMEKSCLQCHSTPDRAPGDLVKIYGPTRGFGRLEGEVVHAISIRIPLAEAYVQVTRLSWQLSGILVALLGCLFASQTWIGKSWLFNPMAALRQKALEIAESDARLGETIPVPPGPELRDLTTAFNAMSRNLRKSHDSLEERVRQRTVDLSHLNERLEQDILQRQRAEGALRETTEALQALIQASPLAIVSTDTAGRLTSWNAAAERIFGWREAEVLGNLPPIIPEDWQGRFPEIHRRQLCGDLEVNGMEVPVCQKDGAIRMARLFSSPQLSATGEVVGAVSIFEDITERKQAEEALLESEEKFRLVFEKAPIGIMLYDQINVVTACNEKFEEIIGAPKEQFLDFNLIRQLRDEQMREAVAASLRGEVGYYEGDYRSVTSGKSTTIRAICQPIFSPEGVVSGGVTIFEDITERKKAEVELLRFSKLESMSILAGGIAHDFNNILTTILGNIGLAMLNRKLVEEEIESLAQAEQACFRAQELSGQLLTFAKGGAPIKKVTSLAKLVRESGKLALAGSRSRCEFSIPEVWSVEADEGQINQVINNLLINADQAMPSGGVIKIAAENIVVEEGSDLPLPGGKYVRLTINDQGIGIHSQYLNKIFDPYFTTKQKGSGLGLATTYSIIKNHSGHIKVESQLGVGTTFEVFLPALEAETLDAHEEPVTPIIGQGRILVMDDDEKIREVLSRMLGKLGYEADSASDGTQALEKFIKAKESGRPFDAVILDLTIPGGMGGKETIGKLLRIDPQVKAIVSSGYSDAPIMANFAEYGFSEVIAKPYRVVEMSKILARVISKKGD